MLKIVYIGYVRISTGPYQAHHLDCRVDKQIGIGRQRGRTLGLEMNTFALADSADHLDCR